MDSVAMEGLATRIDEIDFKIMKGAILRPALSVARELFYQHSHRSLWQDESLAVIASLVVLWECDEEGKNLRMYLVCPQDGSGTLLWRELIPPPAEWIASSSPALSDSDSDLDISREEPGKKKKDEKA